LWFYFLIALGTLITISSNNWLSCWIGLEINLISFIPLLFKKTKKKSIESSLIYFLFQSFASFIFLFSILITFYLNIYNFINYLILISLLIKIGRAPFHFWILLVIENLNWISRFILITWQKIASFIILFICLNNKIIFIFIIFCSFFRSIFGLNQISLQKIIGYSSINHIRWLLRRIIFRKFLWFNYFLFYFIILLRIVIIFYKFNLFYLNQIYIFWKNFFLKLIIFFNLLSIGGLPPFLGFFPKILVINKLIDLKLFVLIFFIILFILIVLFYYLRIIYFSLILNSLNLKNYFFKNNLNNFILYFRLFNNFILIIIFLFF